MTGSTIGINVLSHEEVVRVMYVMIGNYLRTGTYSVGLSRHLTK